MWFRRVPSSFPKNRGNDGTFNVYLGSFDKMQRIAQLDYSLGSAYEQLATLLPEVTGSPLEAFFDCDQINVTEVSDLPRIEPNESKRPKKPSF